LSPVGRRAFADILQELILTGGGSWSAILQEMIASELSSAQVDIVHAEPRDNSAVALGSMYMLLDSTFCNEKFARASFGTKQNVPYDERLHIIMRTQTVIRYNANGSRVRELPDRLTWGVFMVNL
jgi:hypothetical protein